jgi:hypothetical protein
MVLLEGKKSQVTPPGIDPGTVRLVAQRLNHYATPDPLYNMYSYKFRHFFVIKEYYICALLSYIDF